jgi:lipoprotein-anchoring transpeptidase ErfK/SrfK
VPAQAGGIDLTRRIDRLAAPGRGGRRGRIVTRASGAALAAALAALLAGPADAATAREKPNRRGEAKRAQPDKLPNGPLLIIVSIGSQHVSLYADGTFVARGPVSTGMHGHPTPVGVFSVIQKDRFHRSNIYSLAPMPYMQRITWSGVALHQGVLPGYPASHGCIRMSTDFAIRLWGITKLGARVIVARSDVTPAEIANPHLFVRAEPKAEPVAERKVELRPSIETTPAVMKAAVRAAAPAPAVSAAALRAADPDDPDGMGGDPVIATASADPPPAAEPAPPADPPTIDAAKAAGDAAMQAEAPRKPGAVSVFVSRKTGRLYVRQNYQPLFDVPVEIRDPERPFGTHVFTALDVQNGGAGMRWAVVTMPGDAPVRAERESARGKRKIREERDAGAADAKPSPTATDALNRIEMPKEAVERISEMLTPGSSLIVSDQPISEETGRDTDFIILTH